MAFEHISVLAEEVLEGLDPRSNCVYVDGTLGGAGHARRILEAASCTLIGIDRDPMALEAARAHLVGVADRATLVHGQYSEIADILTGVGIDQVDGILLDLGVSSPQLDHADRGFSFMKPGPLDMRMDPTRGQTALELIESTDVESLGDILNELGEERYGKRIARMIKEAAKEGRLATTTDLAAICTEAIPSAEQRRSKIHPATRTFQGLRIAVNGELTELEKFLDVFPDLLKPGGRCAVISFHSLEDRLVKNRFRDLTWTTSLPERFAVQAGERVHPVVEPITRKAIVATDEEIEANPRSRSAKLRICERTEAPNVPAVRA